VCEWIMAQWRFDCLGYTEEGLDQSDTPSHASPWPLVSAVVRHIHVADDGALVHVLRKL